METRRKIEEIIVKFSVKSFVDIPCGDLNWMKLVSMHGASYTGMDIAEHMIQDLAAKYPDRKFKHHDFVTDPLPATSPDVVMSRDIFFHLGHSSVLKAVQNIKASGAK